MKAEIVEKLSDLSAAAFGLVAALAWNGFIQSVFKEVFGASSTMIGMFVYAVLVTIIAVLATMSIGKAAEKAKNINVDIKKAAEAARAINNKLKNDIEKAAKKAKSINLKVNEVKEVAEMAKDINKELEKADKK